MRLAHCERPDGGTFWGVVDAEGGSIRPIHGQFADWAPALTSAIGGKNGIEPGRDALPLGAALPLAGLRLLPPVERNARVVVAGANYGRHLDEFGIAPPRQPFAFLKAMGALVGARDPIRYPPLTSELDHEVELVAVIGVHRVDRANPLASVLGYTVGNDVSARDLQRSGPAGIGMDLMAAKSQDRSTPVGPWIVTRDEFGPDSPALRMTLSVDGDIRQDGSSGDMTWGVGELIRFVDERTSFGCGDLLFTGTPDGVGQGSGRYLKPGQLVEATIEGIGTLSNRVDDKA